MLSYLTLAEIGMMPSRLPSRKRDVGPPSARQTAAPFCPLIPGVMASLLPLTDGSPSMIALRHHCLSNFGTDKVEKSCNLIKLID